MSFATSDVTQKLSHVQKRTQEMIEAGRIQNRDFSRLGILTGNLETLSYQVKHE